MGAKLKGVKHLPVFKGFNWLEGGKHLPVFKGFNLA